MSFSHIREIIRVTYMNLLTYVIQENSVSSYILSQMEDRPKVIFKTINAMFS